MDHLSISTAAVKVAQAIAVAGVIGGGAAVLEAQRTNAVQDAKIIQLEKAEQKIERLSEKLDATNNRLERLIGALERAEGARK